MDWKEWVKQNTLWLVCCGLIGLTGFYIGTQTKSQSNSALSKNAELILIDENLQENHKTIKVYVCGEVEQNKVVELPADARWEDAIKAAGGLTLSADSNQINMAKPLKNGEKVFVPAKIFEAGSPGANVSTKSSLSTLIPINSASKEELMALPGIGESKAQAIIQYREDNGRFEELEDLMKVNGIGEKTFDKLKELIRLD